MAKTLSVVSLKLSVLVLMSTLWLAVAGHRVVAHEVTPTIGDLTVDGPALTLQLRLNVEAFVAGINLDGM